MKQKGCKSQPSKIETEGLQKPELVEEEPSKIETEGLQKSAKLVEDEILKIEESIIEKMFKRN